jgi:hypothetical protein
MTGAMASFRESRWSDDLAKIKNLVYQINPFSMILVLAWLDS